MSDAFKQVELKLEKLASPGIVPGLARLHMLLPLIGNPQKAFPAVHVVGTNGKGSTCAALSSIFTEAGYKTALYTSPHLASFGERLEIGGKRVSPEKWAEAAKKIETALAASKELQNDRPTYFELITAAVFFIIARENPDIAIVEAGLGGRLDATNTLENVLLSLITPIGVDHTDYLGETLAEIAAEKFAVVRKNTPAIFAGGEVPLEKQFKQTAYEKNANPFLLLELCSVTRRKTGLDGTDFSIFWNAEQKNLDLHTPLIGLFQPDNAALACCAAQLLQERFPELDEDALKKGVAKTRWEGRIEKAADNPVLIFDGAHNPHAMKKLAETLREIYPPDVLNIVFAAMADKDVRLMLDLMKGLSPTLYCTQVPDLARSMKADSLAASAQAHGLQTAGSFENPVDAIRAARATGGPTICCGSLYMIGWVKEHMDDER